MAGVEAPRVVAAAALAAMQMTARAWGFEAPAAVEAVMLKIISRPPLTFINPHVWLLLSIIRGSSPDHEVWDDLASTIWKAVNKARVAQAGSSSCVTVVTGRLKTMQGATEAWQHHYRMRDRCELRIRTVSEAIKGTKQEVEELRVEMGRAQKEGFEATRLAVMDG